MRAAASGTTLKVFLQGEGVAYSTYNYWYYLFCGNHE